MSFALNDFRYPLSGQAPDQIVLSKSRFIAGVQCLKRLHLQTYAAESEEVADASHQGHLEEGRQVGEHARTAFPGGVLVESGNFAKSNVLAQTAAIIENASVPAIFEAAFRFQGVFIRVDILQRISGNRWRLIEVKSSTSCKEHYLYDLAIQLHVLSGCGLDVSSACLMHLDRSYVYDGQSHDATKLFTIADLTSDVRAIEKEVPGLLVAQRNVLLNPIPPTIPPGGHCRAPYECEFFSTCNLPLPANHVSMLPNLSAKKAAMLAEANICLVSDIPFDFPMSELQQRVCDCVKSGRPWFSESMSGELSELQYPLHFMDFETLFPAIPRHAGMGPYSHVPFQWSVHRQQTPGAAVDHFEFLAEDGDDPRWNFFYGLSRVVGDAGNIVAYNASFEIQRLEELACWFPECRPLVDAIKARVWDLLPFVRKNVYHPDFGGSFSLKAVLPALLPELTYEGMEVGNGVEAGVAWEEMLSPGTTADRKSQIRQALLSYCRQDTWAMVALLEFLKSRPKPDDI